MPVSAPASLPFTPRMDRLLNVLLPEERDSGRRQFLGEVLVSIENRAEPAAAIRTRAQGWGALGRFQSVYAALQPHMSVLDTEERLALWKLKGLGEVYATHLPEDFMQATARLDQWMEQNQPRMAAALSSAQVETPEPRIDDLQAELFTRLGYLLDQRFAHCHAERRMAMAVELARVCRHAGFETITEVELARRPETLEEVLLLWNRFEPDHHLAVDPQDLLRSVETGAELGPHLPVNRRVTL